MILTFFICMAFITSIFITLFALCTWDDDDNLPIVGYFVSVGWQIVSFAVSVIPSGPQAIHQLKMYSNFTEPEFMVAMIGLSIGLVTTIVIFFDFGWYESMVKTKMKIGKWWQNNFPSDQLVPKEPKKKKQTKKEFEFDHMGIISDENTGLSIHDLQNK